MQLHGPHQKIPMKEVSRFLVPEFPPLRFYELFDVGPFIININS
jgi:hypothetical protein